MRKFVNVMQYKLTDELRREYSYLFNNCIPEESFIDDIISNREKYINNPIIGIPWYITAIFNYCLKDPDVEFLKKNNNWTPERALYTFESYCGFQWRDNKVLSFDLWKGSNIINVPKSYSRVKIGLGTMLKDIFNNANKLNTPIIENEKILLWKVEFLDIIKGKLYDSEFYSTDIIELGKLFYKKYDKRRYELTQVERIK